MIDSAFHFESTATKPSCENIKFSYMVMHILHGISYLFEMDRACSSINIIVTLVFNMDRLKFYYIFEFTKDGREILARCQVMSAFVLQFFYFYFKETLLNFNLTTEPAVYICA